MTSEKEKYKIDNPLVVDDARINALNEALARLQHAIKVLEESKKGSENAIEELKELEKISKIVNEVYLQRKINYTIENKFIIFSRFLNTALNLALHSNLKDKNEYSKISYVKHTKQLLTNG